MGGFDGHADQLQYRGVQPVGLGRKLAVATVDSQGVLGEVIGAYREEIHFRCQGVGQQGTGGHFNHHAHLQALAGNLGADPFDDGLGRAKLFQVLDHGKHDSQWAVVGSRQQRAHLGFEDFRSRQ